MTNDTHALRDWIGKSDSSEETITLDPVVRFHATLDAEGPSPVAGGELPPLWHWLYFLPKAPTREIGPDGHAKRGGFLPPIELPRRMFAGSHIDFHAPLEPGTGTRAACELLRQDVPHLEEDRVLFEDLRASARLIASGSVLEVAENGMQQQIL